MVATAVMEYTSLGQKITWEASTRVRFINKDPAFHTWISVDNPFRLFHTRVENANPLELKMKTLGKSFTSRGSNSDGLCRNASSPGVLQDGFGFSIGFLEGGGLSRWNLVTNHFGSHNFPFFSFCCFRFFVPPMITTD